jgi:hypothetical protein
MRHGKIAEPVEKRYIFGLSIRILSSEGIGQAGHPRSGRHHRQRRESLSTHLVRALQYERVIMSSDSKRPCPRCGGSKVFQSHSRGPMERHLLRAIGFRAFRCVNCNARFYRRSDSGGRAPQNIKAA